MATSAEIVFSVKELLKDHTDDTLIENDHVLFLVKSYRNLLLRQLYSDRSKGYDASAIQSFCVGMKRTDSGVCGTTTGCFILRSEQKIPGLLSVKGRSSLVRVGPPIIGAAGYDLISPDYVSICMDDKYASNSAFVLDDYIYLVGKEPSVNLVKCVSVTGIFDNPDALKEYSTCDTWSTSKTPCVTEESEFPIPAFMVTTIINEIVKDFKGTRDLVQTRDRDNNAVPE